MGTSRALKWVFGLMLLFPGGAAWADREPAANRAIHELIVSSTRGNLLFSDAGSTIGFSAGYNVSLVPGLQVGLGMDLIRVAAGGTSTTTFSMVFGPTLNLPFGGGMVDDFFIGANIGFIDITTTRVLFNAAFGKRFHLVGPLTYRPSFGIQIIQGGSLQFFFQVVSFSAFF
jgi:hypothetical protein